MSEHLAEATVLIRPVVSGFRADLDRQLRGALGTAEKSSSNLTRSLDRQAGAQQVLGNATKKTRAEFLGLGSASAKLDSALLGLRTAVGSSAVIGLGAGALAAIVLGKALRTLIGDTAAFERELNVFQATTGATADQMNRVSKAALQLGADITLPSVTAQDAAEAMTGLAKAGLTVQQALDGTRGVLQLATAAAIDNAAAVEIAAGALNAFGLAGNQAEHVADVLANAANSAQGSISDMGIALQQAAAVGRQVGLSFEDTSTFLTILARNGLRGSDAGTSLRTALIRLINPTDEARAVINKLGVELRDAEGNLRVDVFQQFAAALSDVSPAARDSTLALIGGQDALRAFSILGRQSIEDLLRFRAELRKQGTAADVAAARTKGLSGAAGGLSSTLQTLGVTAGNRVAPGIAEFVNSVTASVSAISSSEGVIAGLNVAMAAVGAAAQVAGSAFTTLGPLALNAASGIGNLTSALGGPAMLAGIAALIATRKAMTALTTTGGLAAAPGLFGGLTRALTSARNAMAAFAAASVIAARTGGITTLLSGTLSGLAGFASKGSVVGLAVAGLAAGLVYLITRESETERATKALHDATEELAGAMARATSAASGLAGAERSADTTALGVTQAQLAQAFAQRALAESDAMQGSIERRQLELNLAVATQNITFATQDYKTALDDLAVAQEENLASTRAANAARAREVESVKELVRLAGERARFVAPGTRNRGADIDSATSIRRQITAREQLVEQIRNEARVSAASESASQRALGVRQALLAAFIRETEKMPTEKSIDIILKTPNLAEALRKIAPQFGIEGREAARLFVQQVTDNLEAGQNIVKAVENALAGVDIVFQTKGMEGGDAFMRAAAAGIRNGQGEVDKAIDEAASKTSRRLTAGINRARRQETTLRIEGAGPGQMLANLQDQENELREQISEMKPGPSQEGVRGELADVIEQQVALQDQVASDAKAAGDKLQDARDKADQTVIDAMTGRRGRLENLQTRAERSPGLLDDIKFNEQLQALLRKQMTEGAKKIKNLEDRNAFIRETNRIILALENQRQQDQRDFNKQLHQRAQDRQRTILDRIQLNIDFAQITEDEGAEIKARQARIRALQAQQRALVKEKGQRAKNTNAYRELRNEIARETAAIKELRKEKEEQNKTSDGFNKLAFEFLQKQQGFAANLLGNLIPGSAAGGLVGASQDATPTPASGLQAQAAFKTASPTYGQMATEVDVLKQVLQVLREIQRGRAHPEAALQRAQVNSTMDFQGGV